MRARIIGMLGGRSAEEIVYGTKKTGAENDIKQATQLAQQMVTQWGMSEKLGMVQFAESQNPYLGGSHNRKSFSEDTSKLIDAEIRSIIHECHDEAIRLLKKYRPELDALVNALLERETLNEEEILEVTDLSAAPPLKTDKLPID